MGEFNIQLIAFNDEVLFERSLENFNIRRTDFSTIVVIVVIYFVDVDLGDYL